jgi:hypothetical protein
MKIEQPEYSEQPRECHLAFLIEMEKRGIKSQMGKYIDEALYYKEIQRLTAIGELQK